VLRGARKLALLIEENLQRDADFFSLMDVIDSVASLTSWNDEICSFSTSFL